MKRYATGIIVDGNVQEYIANWKDRNKAEEHIKNAAKWLESSVNYYHEDVSYILDEVNMQYHIKQIVADTELYRVVYEVMEMEVD